MKIIFSLALLSTLSFAEAKVPLPAERIIILATNDIHGGLEPSRDRKDGIMGGMPFFSGVVKAIREATPSTYERRDVFLVDAGDQFQGTLLSNFDEGELLIKTMVKVGYDAVVPGNHDYDFGPKDWLKDKIDPNEDPAKSKEVIRRLTQIAKKRFPFLSANTYLVNSLKDKDGELVPVKNNLCAPKTDKAINWKAAERPDFLTDHLILKSETLSARVAVIGLDNPSTASQTLFDNVSDLCFRDPFETYVEVRERLKGKADIFILVIHDGDTDKTHPASDLAARLGSFNPPLVDAVIAGHTHFINDEKPNQIPVIQSASGGRRFGRVELIWDPIKKRVLREHTQQYAGVRLFLDKCDEKATFCTMKEGQLFYDGQPAVSDQKIAEMITSARAEFKGADQVVVAQSKDLISPDRIHESALSNIVADGLLAVARAQKPETEVAIVNASGLRTDIQPGEVTYEKFYAVLPFNNRGVVVGPMKTTALVELVKYSITTCGKFGTLIPAGLRVEFERRCPEKNGDLDPDAKLLKVELLTKEGETKVLFDVKQSITPNEEDTVLVATLDFLTGGGEGFSWLKQPLVQDLGVARESLVKHWFTTKPVWANKKDGRWKANLRVD